MSERFYVIYNTPARKFFATDGRTVSFNDAERFADAEDARWDLNTLETTGGWRIVGPCIEGERRS